jgi:hypothetical protein
MAAPLKTVAGNTAPPWDITCKRPDGTIIDLTGCTVEVIIAKGATITQTGRAASVVSPMTDGVIEYTPLATDCPTKGSYKCDVAVTYGDGGFEILYDQLKVKARKPLV